MTLDDAQVGHLIKKYDANQQNLRGLEQSFDVIIKLLASLSEIASKQSMSIEVTDTDFRSGFGNTQIPRDIVEQFADCLVLLRSACDERSRLEVCLSQAGLSRFIQKSSEPDEESKTVA